MKFVLLTVFLNLSVSSPVTSPCRVASNSPTPGGRIVEVTCDDDTVNFTVQFEDGDSASTLVVSGSRMGEDQEFLKVEHHVGSRDMYLTISGQRFHVKDNNLPSESAAMKNLLNNPAFASFPSVIQLIHDQLQLPGWESPSVMFLYRIGMSLDNHPLPLRKRFFVDSDLYDYHGASPAKQCEQNGQSNPDVEELIAGNCIGVCGPKCMMCWDWVCGDCCVHTGCQRHDQFCRGESGKFTKDCLTLRGVLWDTITDTPYDC